MYTTTPPSGRRNAYAIASVQGTPGVFNDNFFSVDIPPTWVHGGFFVGASAKLDGGADKPARIDRDASGDKSWFFYAPDIAATIDDLAAAPFGTRNDNPQYVVLPLGVHGARDGRCVAVGFAPAARARRAVGVFS